ncbi:EAL domain-containing protein [Nitrosomonas sp.]|uniref:EAL domain-containing protein n=1 Tax=Nitrosomonas sp. TaxID=42353 RepID=UPI002632602F|nr:EAL domain-containing protein [Nitrosomonas sp.]
MSSKDKTTTDRKRAFIPSSAEHSSNSAASSMINSLESKINQLEDILNQVDACIYTKDRAGRYTYVNQNVVDLFGAPAEGIIDREDKEFFDLTLSDDLIFDDSRVIEFGQTIKREERMIIKSSGQTRFFWTVKSPMMNDQGQIIGEFGISTDITERKLAEDMLRFHSNILQGLPIGVCLIRANDEQIVYANPQFETRFGCGVDELLGQHINSINISTLAGPLVITDSIATEIERAGIWTGETYSLKKDGTIFWCYVTISTFDHPLFGKTWVLALINITAHKRIEDMLCLTSQRLSLATRTTGIGIWEWDVVQNKLIWDHQMFVLYGVSQDNFRGEYEHWCMCIHPEDLQQTEKEIQIALCEKRDFNTEFRICRPDGTICYIHAIATVLYDAAGQPIRMIGTNRDITSLRQTFDSMLLADAIYQTSGEAIMITDENNLIKQVNPAFTRLTGYELSEVVGKNPRIFCSERHDKIFYRSIWQDIQKKNHWQGEIWGCHRDGTIRTRWLNISAIHRPDGQVYGYVTQFSDITEKKQKEELILFQANFDQLTMLPNRFLFKDRLGQETRKAHRSGQLLAVIYLDLDHFKDINDTLGHAAGDQLLKEVGQRIKSCVRDTDTVARLGGDEFAIILPSIDFRQHVEKIARHIICELNQPFNFLPDQADYHISTSIGIVFYPEDGMDIESLMKHADQAMYAAKQGGRDRYCYFTPSLQHKANEKMMLTNDLRKALERNELHVYYQPILDLSRRRIIKAEALLRWKHPCRGMINPHTFIPLAEESGLIVKIGEWVFDQSIAHIQQWLDRFGYIIQVSINKSPIQFQTSDRPGWYDKLVHCGLPGDCINVEITEGLLLRSTLTVQNFLLEFRNNGIQVSIDDFGTGFSSLSYLKEFDIDYIKIDRSFISNLNNNPIDRALVEAIIMMAHKLDIKTIAEGVETQEQQNLLIEFGCDYVQGFLYSPPIPIEEFEKLITL